MTVRAGIYGGSGYTGQVLAQILARHPAAELIFATSNSHAGTPLRRLSPAAPDVTLIDPVTAPVDQIDVAFLCLPHGASAEAALALLEVGVRVVDLSADFRLKDASTYAAWYHAAHPAPALLTEAVYGLTEWARPDLPAARLVANPGCYPTSILMPVGPLLQAGALTGTIIADSKSGVSGAGRAPKQHTHFVEVADNFSPYGIGQSHRHWPEIVQGLGRWQAPAPELIFSPHLLPVPRGILSTIYLSMAPGWDAAAVRGALDAAYAGEPFVRVLPAGELASLAHVNYTNSCAIGVAGAGHMVILTSAIDNLVKGASGQAVQNMNVMFGLDETSGLL